MIGQIMRVCRDCADRNLPECCRGGCEKRDAWLDQQRAARVALRREHDEEIACFEAMKHGRSWRVR